MLKRYHLWFKPDPNHAVAHELVRQLVHNQLVRPVPRFDHQVNTLFNRIRFRALAIQKKWPDLAKKARVLFTCKPYGGFAQVYLKGHKTITLKYRCEMVKWCPHCYASRLGVIIEALHRVDTAGYVSFGMTLDVTAATWPERRQTLNDCRQSLIQRLKLRNVPRALICTLMRPVGDTWTVRCAVIVPQEPGEPALDLIEGVSCWNKPATNYLEPHLEPLAYPAVFMTNAFLREKMADYLENLHNVKEIMLWGHWPKVMEAPEA